MHVSVLWAGWICFEGLGSKGACLFFLVLQADCGGFMHQFKVSLQRPCPLLLQSSVALSLSMLAHHLFPKLYIESLTIP